MDHTDTDGDPADRDEDEEEERSMIGRAVNLVVDVFEFIVDLG